MNVVETARLALISAGSKTATTPRVPAVMVFPIVGLSLTFVESATATARHAVAATMLQIATRSATTAPCVVVTIVRVPAAITCQIVGPSSMPAMCAAGTAHLVWTYVEHQTETAQLVRAVTDSPTVALRLMPVVNAEGHTWMPVLLRAMAFVAMYPIRVACAKVMGPRVPGVMA